MLTADELRRRLGWPGIDEEVNDEYQLVYLFVRPTQPGLEPIYLCLGADRSSLTQFGFGEWHCHPDEVDEAMEMAGQLIRGECCLVEERNAAGRYLGSGLYPPDGVPDTIGIKAASLRRVFFDRAPIAEPIDFGRFVRGRHLWIAHEHKAETERVFREAGQRPPEW